MKNAHLLHSLLALSAILFVAPLCAMEKEQPADKYVLSLHSQTKSFIESGKSLLILHALGQNKTVLSLNPVALDAAHKKLLITEIKKSAFYIHSAADIEYLRPWVDKVIADSKITGDEKVEQELKKHPLEKIQIYSGAYKGNNLELLKCINIPQTIVRDLPELETVELEIYEAVAPSIQIQCGEQSVPLASYAQTSQWTMANSLLFPCIIPLRALPFFYYLQKNYQNLDTLNILNNKAKIVTISGKQFNVRPEFLTVRAPSLLKLEE